ncbi:hypothetical protein M427DRAFT_53054 [Gonapodya prolifera JEL478]|uniref:LIM zinc-binding domain-containing protein n=1 Tax=Gonapodya prolifera (strain JEL478) TaxID=1344416 RepID=A0A139ASD0_GONPJ|nr:hypothetical protein M427DRAFT_53054 [Gonapodya prolifera JEL478]|eukprot:KXS19647.1 hypothetical protein M427DRAFT_53054 [Gonapodya prolifera JEL478]
MPPKFGGAPDCPRCKQKVYMAEQVAGPGGMWHKRCLTCKQCGKSVDSTTLTEKDSEAYCKTCYGKNWGPRGYGYAGGGAGLMSSHESLPLSGHVESAAGSTSKLGSEADAASTTSQPVSAPAPAPAPAPVPPSLPDRSSHATPRGSASNLALGGGTDTCPKCAKRVYFAEQVLGPNNTKWHKLCFRCSDCNKVLDQGTAQETKEKPGEVFCRGCYGKKWGPKEYRFASGGAFMATQ